MDLRFEEAKKRAEEADVALAEINGENPEEDSDGEEPAPVPVVDDDESGDSDTLQAGEVSQDGHEEPVEEPEEPNDELGEEDLGATPVDEDVVSKADYDKLQHSYDVLKGMHERQVTEVAAENRYLRADLRDLTAERNQLAQQVEELQKGKAVQEVEDVAFASFVDDPAIKDLADEHGENIVKVLFKHISSAVAPLKKEVESLSQTVRENSERARKTTAQTSQELFLNRLGRIVPDWEEIDASDDFRKYLLEFAPGTGRPRNDFLKEHLGSQNLKGLAQIFLEYKEGKTSLGDSIGKGKVFKPQPKEAQVVPKAGRAPQKSGAKRPPEKWDAPRVKAFIAYCEGASPTFEGKKLSPGEKAWLEKDMYSSRGEGRYVGK